MRTTDCFLGFMDGDVIRIPDVELQTEQENSAVGFKACKFTIVIFNDGDGIALKAARKLDNPAILWTKQGDYSGVILISATSEDDGTLSANYKIRSEIVAVSCGPFLLKSQKR